MTACVRVFLLCLMRAFSDFGAMSHHLLLSKQLFLTTSVSISLCGTHGLARPYCSQNSCGAPRVIPTSEVVRAVERAGPWQRGHSPARAAWSAACPCPRLNAPNRSTPCDGWFLLHRFIVADPYMERAHGPAPHATCGPPPGPRVRPASAWCLLLVRLVAPGCVQHIRARPEVAHLNPAH